MVKKKLDSETLRHVPVKARNSKQSEYIKQIHDNDITICLGPAGVGKTNIAVGMAVEYLMAKKVSKIVLTRPAVECGRQIGFLPGTQEEKIQPYLIPLLDEILYYLDNDRHCLEDLQYNRVIEIAPLELMNGRTFKDAFVVLDEASNCTKDQLKMFITRIGLKSKFVITGNPSHSDLRLEERENLQLFYNRLVDVDSVGSIRFENKDIVRHPIIEDLLKALETF